MIIFYEWNKIWRVRKLFQPPLSFFFFQLFLLSFSCFFFLNTFFPALVLILETKFLIVFTIKPSMSLFKSLKFKTNRKSWICDSFNQQWYTKKNKKKRKKATHQWPKTRSNWYSETFLFSWQPWKHVTPGQTSTGELQQTCIFYF